MLLPVVVEEELDGPMDMDRLHLGHIVLEEGVAADHCGLMAWEEMVVEQELPYRVVGVGVKVQVG
jgi:hypothetical protein